MNQYELAEIVRVQLRDAEEQLRFWQRMVNELNEALIGITYPDSPQAKENSRFIRDLKKEAQIAEG